MTKARRPRPDAIDGPTPEQIANGTYTRSDARMNPDRPFMRACPTYLDRLVVYGTITAAMCEAGKRFEQDDRTAWGTSGRDSTIPPVGGMAHETEAQAERIVRAKARMAELLAICGPGTYAIVRQVAAYDQPMRGRDRGAGRLVRDRLRSGLTAAIRVYGVQDN